MEQKDIEDVIAKYCKEYHIREREMNSNHFVQFLRTQFQQLPIEAIEFADWLSDNYYKPTDDNILLTWENTNNNFVFTSEELYQQFKQCKS